MTHKFWIVEYVDVNVPKVERSEIVASCREAVQRVAKRGGFIHYSTLENFAERGLCDYITNAHLFDNAPEAR